MSDRVQTVPFRTQAYRSVRHDSEFIDMYVTEPAAGVRETTGLLLLIHGFGNDGMLAYESESMDFADRFDLVVTRVEYRLCGRESHHYDQIPRIDVPYDLSKMQTIDCLRAAYATLARYPRIDRSRLYIWGGSQGAHIGAQCLIFAPHLWALAVLLCGIYQVLTPGEVRRMGFGMDRTMRGEPGLIERAWGGGDPLEPHELEIRDPYRNASMMPAQAPIALIHGTMDDAADIKHSVFLYARLLALGRDARFFAVDMGNHGLNGARRDDENTRLKATVKYAGDLLQEARRPDVQLEPPESVRIPVTGGVYVVDYFSDERPTLTWKPE